MRAKWSRCKVGRGANENAKAQRRKGHGDVPVVRRQTEMEAKEETSHTPILWAQGIHDGGGTEMIHAISSIYPLSLHRPPSPSYSSSSVEVIFGSVPDDEKDATTPLSIA